MAIGRQNNTGDYSVSNLMRYLQRFYYGCKIFYAHWISTRPITQIGSQRICLQYNLFIRPFASKWPGLKTISPDKKERKFKIMISSSMCLLRLVSKAWPLRPPSAQASASSAKFQAAKCKLCNFRLLLIISVQIQTFIGCKSRLAMVVRR